MKSEYWIYTCGCNKVQTVTDGDARFCYRCGKPVNISPIPPPGYQKAAWWNKVRFRALWAFDILLIGESLIVGLMLWLPEVLKRKYIRPLYFPRGSSIEETNKIQLSKDGVPGWRFVSSEARDIAHEILNNPELWNPNPAEDLLELTEEALSEIPVEQLKKLKTKINKVLKEKGPKEARKEIRFERKSSCLYLTIDDESQLVPFDI